LRPGGVFPAEARSRLGEEKTASHARGGRLARFIHEQAAKGPPVRAREASRILSRRKTSGSRGDGAGSREAVSLCVCVQPDGCPRLSIFRKSGYRFSVRKCAGKNRYFGPSRLLPNLLGYRRGPLGVRQLRPAHPSQQRDRPETRRMRSITPPLRQARLSACLARAASPRRRIATPNAGETVSSPVTLGGGTMGRV
jgi:hypothetical protein